MEEPPDAKRPRLLVEATRTNRFFAAGAWVDDHPPAQGKEKACCRNDDDEELGDDAAIMMSTPAVSQLSELAKYTFRLEHYNQKPKHDDSGRFLVFRSDRRGAVAKLVYSVATPESKPRTTSTSRSSSIATIEVLECKPDCRGHDLGGLLCHTVLRFLVLHAQTTATTSSSSGSCNHNSLICELHAEEDQSRYNRLVQFYQKYGFQIKPNAKIQYLSHQTDGQVYRKVPMHLEINIPAPASDRKVQLHQPLLLLGQFLPVHLDHDRQKRLTLLPRYGRHRQEDEHNVHQWLLSQHHQHDSNHFVSVEWRTTNGQVLQMDENGQPEITTTESTTAVSSSTTPHQFQLLRTGPILWMMRSISRGTYLSLDPIYCTFQCQTRPQYWKLDQSSLRFICTDDTPHRQHYYRQYNQTQTVAYVQSQRQHYQQQFQQLTHSRQLSIQQVLEMAKDQKGYPWGENDGMDLRTRCFAIAESLRRAGHADWMQLIGLIYHLGQAISSIDHCTATAAVADHHHTITFPWQYSARARVMGTEIPETFFHYSDFNCSDFNCKDMVLDDLSVPYKCHCGLLSPDVLLSWTGPEYMFHMVRHNQIINIPEDGMYVLRLASLDDWHSGSAYRELENSDDMEIKEFVAECAEIILSHPDSGIANVAVDLDCDGLWTSHYGRVVAKYQADGMLSW